MKSTNTLVCTSDREVKQNDRRTAPEERRNRKKDEENGKNNDQFKCLLCTGPQICVILKAQTDDRKAQLSEEVSGNASNDTNVEYEKD